jgi:transposase InsO family protein
MIQKEVDQVGIFEKLKEKSLSQSEAAQVLHLSVRQVKRKLKRYHREGAVSLIHAARGKPGNRTFTPVFKEKVLAAVEEHYSDFAPTLASEKLEELQGLVVNKETLRQWMADAGLWQIRTTKQGEVHVWRERRNYRGELVQADGSDHDWFEGRAPKCCLLAFIDDATSEPLWLEFVKSESTESLFIATRHYLEKDGRPLALYVDRGKVYKVNLGNEDGKRLTQYQRALRELSVELIHARSPQAKGRVERLFGTLQDRLVKELRLRGISSMEEANRYLREEYLVKHTAKFAVAPKSSSDMHREITGFNLDFIFSFLSKRTLQNDWCLSYDNRFLQLEKKQPKLLTKRERIEIREYLDGELHLYLRGAELAFKELSERPPKPARVKQPDLRHLGHKPSADHPWHTRINLQTKRDISKLLERDISILV